MEDDKVNSGPGAKLLLPLLTAVIGIWAFIQINQGINTNTSWLTTEASRFLSGERMSEGFYTTNSPLSMLLYTPVAFAVRCFHIPVYYALFIYGLLLTALSAAATWKLLPQAGIEGPTRLAFIASFLIAGTLLAGHHFGDREAILVQGLVPLSVLQAAITRGNRPRWILAGPVIFLGTLAALLKPQFLMVPALWALHRFWQWKSPRAFFAADSLGIAAIVLAYIGFVFIFLHDFVTTVMPDIAFLYVTLYRDSSMLMTSAVLACIAMALIGFTQCVKMPDRNFASALFAGCLAGIFSYVLQGKFFYYHLIPALMFFQIGAAILLAGALRGREALAAAFCFSLLFGIAGNRDWLSPYIYPSRYTDAQGHSLKSYHWPTHDDYRRSELVGLVKKYAPGGSYFIFGSMPIANIPAAYTDSTFGSRFPCLWFLPPLIEADEKLKAGQPAKLTAGQLEAYKKKYNAMVAADFERYKPSLVLVARIYMTEAEKEPFDLVRWLSADAKFVQTWKHYRKIKTISLDSRDYYGGYDYGSASEIATYDVYIADKILVPH